MNKNLLILISILTLNSCNMNNSDLSDGLYADIETSKGNIGVVICYDLNHDYIIKEMQSRLGVLAKPRPASPPTRPAPKR